jgi:polysaccharide biosynthesis protein PslH
LKKILSIVWYKVLPPDFGGQKGIALFNKYLSNHIPLVCLCSDNNEATAAIPYKLIPELPTGKGQFLDPWCWQKITRIAKQEKPSHIILEHPYHAIAAWKAKKASNSLLILHAHNIESERFRELGKWWWRLLRRYEKWIHRKANICLFKTTMDKEFAEREFGLESEKCLVLPYGIERPVRNELAGQKIRQRHNISEDEAIFLFAGTLDYGPNAEAVEKIYREIIPRMINAGIKAKIIICGRNHFEEYQYLNQLSDASVIKAGNVDDIENYFSAANTFINPVQSGGGIQSKNIDALSFHCTTVCFQVMTSGIPFELCGSKLLAARTNEWDEFVILMKKALSVTDNTPERFFDYFDWTNIIRVLVDRISSGKRET